MFRKTGGLLLSIAVIFGAWFVYRHGPAAPAAPVPAASQSTVPDYEPLVDRIEDYLSEQTGQYGVYFISLDDGGHFGLQAKDEYVAASTVKVPVTLYLYTRAAEGKIDLDEDETYTQDDYEEGTGTIAYTAQVGDSFSLRTLAEDAIELSDNVAVNMLIRHLGRSNIYDFEESIVRHPVVRTANESTPKDMALYLKALLDFRDKYPALGNELLDYLENTTYNDRIPAGLPKDVVVAHKIGTEVHVIDDVGIIFGDQPFILAVMSEQVDEQEAPDVIARITQMVYNYVEAA